MSLNLLNQEGKKIQEDIKFPVREDNEWKEISTSKIFKNKRVILFSLPGAFTPTCSTTHLPRYEELYDNFKKLGIDEIYCVSVNDTFVMNEWKKYQEIENVKMLPDGNTHFTESVGMLIDKNDLGFGKRSWRYSMLIEDGKILKHFIEPDKEGDPFEVSDADTMLKYLDPEAGNPTSITIFTKAGCQFCRDAKELLQKHELKYSEIILSDGIRQKVLTGLTGETRPTSPQIFVSGNRVGGLVELKKYLEKGLFSS